MNSLQINNFKAHIQTFMEAAQKEELLQDGVVNVRIESSAGAVFRDVEEMANKKVGFDLREIEKTVQQIHSDTELHSHAKFFILGTIASALNPNLNLAVREEGDDVYTLSDDEIVGAIDAEIEKLMPPVKAPVSKINAEKLSFLNHPAHEVKKAFNPKELEGKVDVKALRKAVEETFIKQKKVLNEKRDQFLDNIQKQIKSDVLFQKAVASMSPVAEARFEQAFDEVHHAIVEEVKVDLAQHIRKLEAVNADQGMVEMISSDLHAITDLPPDMSVEEFLALAYIFHSYEKCLLLDKEKWPKGSEEIQKTNGIVVTLNYYKYFYDHLERMKRVDGWQNIDKHIRMLETDDVYSFFASPHRQKPVDELNLVTVCSDYVENGSPRDHLYTPTPFTAVGMVRLAPPSQIPQWITDTIERPNR